MLCRRRFFSPLFFPGSSLSIAVFFCSLLLFVRNCSRRKSNKAEPSTPEVVSHAPPKRKRAMSTGAEREERGRRWMVWSSMDVCWRGALRPLFQKKKKRVRKKKKTKPHTFLFFALSLHHSVAPLSAVFLFFLLLPSSSSSLKKEKQ